MTIGEAVDRLRKNCGPLWDLFAVLGILHSFVSAVGFIIGALR